VRGHIDTHALAAFREGLLRRRRAARVRAHLSACQDCAAAERQLAGLAGVLASTPAPAMPPGISARIEAALAAEATARNASRQAAAQPGTEQAGLRDAAGAPGIPGPVIPRGPLVPSGSVAASGDGSATGHTPTPEAAGNTPQGGRGARRTRSWLHGGPALRLAGGLAVAAVLAGGVVAITRFDSGSGSQSSAVSSHPDVSSGSAGSGAAHKASGLREPRATPGGLRVVTSSTDYRPATLTAQASALAAQYASPRTALPSPVPAHPLPAFGSQGSLSACVQRVTGGTRPAVVDLAAYNGRPAAIIVAPARQGHAGRVWVVPPGCTGTTGAVLATRPLPAAG
jgi:hypothetical protein